MDVYKCVKKVVNYIPHLRGYTVRLRSMCTMTQSQCDLSADVQFDRGF